MKIAFLSHFDLNLYLFRLPIMIELVKNGNEVYAICPKGEFFNEFEKYGIKAVDYYIDRRSLNLFNELNVIHNIYNALKDINPDVVHTFTHKPNIYGTLAAKFAKIKKIINLIEGLGSYYTSEKLQTKLVRAVIENLYKLIFKISYYCVFVNEDDPRYFVGKRIISKEKVKIIKSVGVDTEKFKPAPKNKNLIKELALDNKPVVLMIARVIRDKGVEEYIKAAEILKDKANFLYVGDIDKGNKNAFIPNWGNVKYLGFRKDIKELISICDIFVLPSYREGVPRTILEAASMDKPIVTTDAVGCREVVEDNKNGFLVPVKDYIELANKIEILINDADLREKFGKYSREKAVKEFDVKIVVKQYMKLYDEIMNV
jgi:N,N'-diacetylbacillosaminyl-diphospho-undecaprenol alpha-1,3-N-acetylgalactosaminyltransferase